MVRGGGGRYLLGSGSAVASARIFSLVCAAIQLPLLTRVLDPSEYSAIAIAIAIAVYFNLLSAEPVILGFERFPGSGDERSNYSFALGRTLLVLAAAMLLVVGIGFLAGRGEYAFAVAGWSIGLSTNRLVSLAWLMWRQPWQYAWNLMAGTGVRTVVLVALVLWDWSPLLSLGIAGLASAVAALAFSPRVGLRALATRGLPHPWPVLFGLNLALAALAYTILLNGNLLVLSNVVSSSRVGTYAVMSQVATLTSAAILNFLLAVAYPPLRLAWDEGDRSRVTSRLEVMQLACLGIALFVVFACYVGDSAILRLLLPADYIDPTVLAPLILATALAAMGGMSSWYHQLDMRATRVARRTILSAALGIGLTIVLSLVLHERGAALGSAVGFFIYLVALHLGTPLPKRTVIIAAACTVLCCTVLFLPPEGTQVVAYLSLGIVIGGTFVLLRRAGWPTAANGSIP